MNSMSVFQAACCVAATGDIEEGVPVSRNKTETKACRQYFSNTEVTGV